MSIVALAYARVLLREFNECNEETATFSIGCNVSDAEAFIMIMCYEINQSMWAKARYLEDRTFIMERLDPGQPPVLLRV